MNYVKIPSKFRVGGQEMIVRQVHHCDDNKLGNCIVASGEINIAEIFNNDKQQSQGSKENTFYHELTHAILDTMGRRDLSDDETFVCTFSGFLTEAMTNAYFKEEESK